jgi:hypothetical protein
MSAVNSDGAERTTPYPSHYVWMKKLDIFRFEPKPRFLRRDQASVRGFIGTAVTLLIVGAYIINTSIRFIGGQPSVSMAQVSTSNDPVQLPPLAITFRVNDEKSGVPSKVFYDPSYFTYYMAETDVFAQDSQQRVVRVIPPTRCNFTDYVGWLGTNAFCPSRAPVIAGRYQSPSYTFFRIDVSLCSNATPPYDQATGQPIVCAPMTEILTVVANGRFNTMLYTVPQGDVLLGGWDAPMYLIDPSQWSLYEGQYQKNFITVEPDMLRTFSEQNYEYLTLFSEKFFQRPPTTSAAINGTYALTLWFRLSGAESHETRQVQTLLDLVGSWAAFFGAVSGALGIYFLAYNTEKFYKLNPHWDDFDTDFVSAHERYVQMNSKKSFVRGADLEEPLSGK